MLKKIIRSLGEGKGINVLKGKMICPIKLMGNYIYQGITSTNRKKKKLPFELFWSSLQQIEAHWVSVATLASCLSSEALHTFCHQHHRWVSAESLAYGLCEDDGETGSHLVHGSQALPDFFLNPTSCSMKEILLSVSPDSRVPQSQVFFGSLGCDPGPHRDSLLPRVMLCVLFKPEFILYLSHF